MNKGQFCFEYWHWNNLARRFSVNGDDDDDDDTEIDIVMCHSD
jgi:hypothetical protein